MVHRLGTKGAELDPEQLQRGLKAHRDEIRSWLSTVPHMEALEVDYPTLVRDPAAVVTRLVEFLGSDRLPTADKMMQVVDESLYRRKASAG
jgi:LPS sulfotransferase NodH